MKMTRKKKMMFINKQTQKKICSFEEERSLNFSKSGEMHLEILIHYSGS